MTKYLLDEKYMMRGWEKLPYAIMEKGTGNFSFLDAKSFEALSICDGKINVDLPLISQETRDIIAEIEKRGIAHKVESGELKDYQEHKIYPNRYVRTAHWSITGKCNYRCKHCFMSAPDAKLGQLSHEVTMDIAKQIVEAGIREVSLTGGEPLIRKDFLEIVEYLVKNDIKIVQIYTNGKLVTRELLEELKRIGTRPEFNMSYDGDEGWHDWLRGMDDASYEVLRAFDLCYEMGFPTGAELCIHKGNKHLLRESINTLAKHNCRSLKTNPVSPTDSWEQYGDDYSIPQKEVFDIYLDYIPKFFEDGMPISIHLGGFFSCGKGRAKWSIPSNKMTGEPCPETVICGHARQTLYISPESRMLPCMPLSGMPIQDDYPLITEVGLSKGLSDSKYMELIDTRLSDYLEHNPECNNCEYRWKCAGGCRACALHTSPTDIMGPDRAICLLFRGKYDERVSRVAEESIAKYVPGEVKEEKQDQ